MTHVRGTDPACWPRQTRGSRDGGSVSKKWYLTVSDLKLVMGQHSHFLEKKLGHLSCGLKLKWDAEDFWQKDKVVIIYQRTSPDPNFIPPSAFVWRYSSAWLDPWQGGIKSLKHKQSSAHRQSGKHICRYNQENKKSTKIRIWCCSGIREGRGD